MACPYTITRLLCTNSARSPIVAVPTNAQYWKLGVKSLFWVLFSICSPWNPKYIWSFGGERWNLMKLDFSKILFRNLKKQDPKPVCLKSFWTFFTLLQRLLNFCHRTKTCKNFFFKTMLSNLYEEHSAWRITGPTDTQT